MPYVARKRITLSGRTYAAGEVIPLNDMGLAPKLVRRLIEQSKVLLKRGVVDTEAPKEAKPALTPKPKAEMEAKDAAPKKAALEPKEKTKPASEGS